MNDANTLDALAAETLSAIDLANAAHDAANAAREAMLARQYDLLEGVASMIEDAYPMLSCTPVKANMNIEVDARSGEYDDEHGWNRCTIRLSITPRYGIRYEVDSLVPRRGEQFGADITTADIGKLLATMATYLPG